MRLLSGLDGFFCFGWVAKEADELIFLAAIFLFLFLIPSMKHVWLMRTSTKKKRTARCIAQLAKKWLSTLHLSNPHLTLVRAFCTKHCLRAFLPQSASLDVHSDPRSLLSRRLFSPRPHYAPLRDTPSCFWREDFSPFLPRRLASNRAKPTLLHTVYDSSDSV